MVKTNPENVTWIILKLLLSKHNLKTLQKAIKKKY